MRPVHLLLTVALLASCASRQGGPARAERDVITRAQIEAMNSAPDAYEVVRRKRPEYLRERQISTQRLFPTVYINGARIGTPAVLRNVRTSEVEQIRFISASDATTRWGTSHAAGVIEVTTRRATPR